MQAYMCVFLAVVFVQGLSNLRLQKTAAIVLCRLRLYGTVLFHNFTVRYRRLRAPAAMKIVTPAISQPITSAMDNGRRRL